MKEIVANKECLKAFDNLMTILCEETKNDIELTPSNQEKAAQSLANTATVGHEILIGFFELIEAQKSIAASLKELADKATIQFQE